MWLLPGGRTVRRVEVGQDAAPLRESHAVPAEIAPGLRHDCGEEGIKAADFLHELVGELIALASRADGWDAVQRMCHEDAVYRHRDGRPEHIKQLDGCDAGREQGPRWVSMRRDDGESRLRRRFEAPSPNAVDDVAAP